MGNATASASSKASVRGDEASSDSSSENEKPQRSAARRYVNPIESEALAKVLEGLSSDSFPTELEEQMVRLCWKRRWQRQVGSYEDFLRQHNDKVRIVRCPRGITFVLPCARDALRDGWSSARYLKACKRYVEQANGKEKKKWKHISKAIERFCRNLDTLAARLASKKCDGDKPPKLEDEESS